VDAKIVFWDLSCSITTQPHQKLAIILNELMQEKEVFSSKCGPSAMSTSPRSSSSSRYHEVNKKEVSRTHGSLGQDPTKNRLQVGWPCLYGIGLGNNILKEII